MSCHKRLNHCLLCTLLLFTIVAFLGCRNEKDQGDVSLFIKAVKEGNLEIAQTVLDKNPSLVNRHIDKQYAMLHVAVHNENEKLLRFLLKNNANINIGTKQDGKTPLHIAATYGYQEMAIILLENGAEVNSRDDMLSTPLHNACLYSTTEMVDLLLSHGAEIDAKREMGATPLFYACSRLKEDEEAMQIIRLLLACGADPNANCPNSDLPLIHATLAQQHFKKTQLLIDYGAKLELKTDEGLRSFTIEEVQELYQQLEGSQQNNN